MNRDKLDNELRNKLGEARVEPPSDMWDRIAATLRQEGLTATEPAAKPSITIRRPRRLRLRYAAAAAVLVCAVVFGLSRFDLGDRLAVGDDTAQQFDIATPQQLEEMIARATRIAEASQNAKEPVQDRIVTSVRRMVTGEETYVPDMVAQDIATVTDIAQAPDTITRAANDAAGRDPVRAARNDASRQAASDNRTEWLDQAEIEKMLRDAKKAERRSKPLSMGLYSANLSNSSSEKVVNSPARAESSDLIIREFANGVYASSSALGATTTKLEHKMPVSGGLSITKGLTGRLSLESGATYTYMLSKGESPSGTTGGTYSIRQELHYVGIPVGVKYEVVQGGRVNLYASAAGLFEMCVSSRRTKKMQEGGISGDSYSESLNVRGIQPSLGVHVGAEVKLAKNLGLYLEPGMNYYFETDRQPDSYRTEHPLNFSLRAGFRVSFK